MNDYVMLKIAQERQAELAREAANRRLVRSARSHRSDPPIAVRHRTVPSIAIVTAVALAAASILLLTLTSMPPTLV